MGVPGASEVLRATMVLTGGARRLNIHKPAAGYGLKDPRFVTLSPEEEHGCLKHGHGRAGAV